MKLELKNVHFSERLSQETNAFAADVYFKGKKVGYAENDGHGGCTNVSHYPEKRDEFKEAMDYAKSLPKIVYEGRGGLKGFELDSNLEMQVDHLFTDWLEEKEIKKNSKKGIYFEQPNGTRSIMSWKGHTLSKILKDPRNIPMVRAKVFQLQNEGNTILNDNLLGILTEKA